MRETTLSIAASDLTGSITSAPSGRRSSTGLKAMKSNWYFFARSAAITISWMFSWIFSSSREAPLQTIMYENPMRASGLRCLILGTHSQMASRSSLGFVGRCIFTKRSLLPESSERRIQSRSLKCAAASDSIYPRLPLYTIAT